MKARRNDEGMAKAGAAIRRRCIRWVAPRNEVKPANLCGGYAKTWATASGGGDGDGRASSGVIERRGRRRVGVGQEAGGQ